MTESMHKDHKDSVRRCMEAEAQADEATLRSVLHENVRFWVPQSAERRGFHRTFEGRDEVVWLLTGQSKAFQPGTTEWKFHHLVAENDFVAAHFNREAIGANGNPYDNEYHMLFRFEDGLIIEVWVMTDSIRAFEILGAEPVPQLPAT